MSGAFGNIYDNYKLYRNEYYIGEIWQSADCMGILTGVLLSKPIKDTNRTTLENDYILHKNMNVNHKEKNIYENSIFDFNNVGERNNIHT
jgi:phospholipid N-methyltransferase